MKKKWIISAIIVVCMLVAALLVYKAKSSAPAPATVTVKKDSITEKTVAVGNIVPKHTISVKSPISGRVGKLFREEGDYVEQGDPLVQVTPAPTPQSIAQANEAVQENLALVAQAEDHTRRITNLHKSGFIAADDYQVAKKDLATANAKLKLAQQNLALLQKGETTIAGESIKSTILSPISGFILQRMVDAGDPVVPITESQAGTALFVIANMQDLIFKGAVDEIDVAKITPGMSADITIAAMPDTKIKGTLNKIALQSDAQAKSQADTKTGKADISSPFNVGFNIEINNLIFPKTVKLRSGYSATGELIIKHVDNVLTIPERVITFKDKKTFVNLPSKNSDKPQQQEVTLGLTDGINAEVVSGLKEGQVVLDNVAVPVDK